jgi:hypothetical protein
MPGRSSGRAINAVRSPLAAAAFKSLLPQVADGPLALVGNRNQNEAEIRIRACWFTDFGIHFAEESRDRRDRNPNFVLKVSFVKSLRSQRSAHG